MQQADFARLIGASTRTVRELGARGILVYEGNLIRAAESLRAYAGSLRKAAHDRAESDGQDLISERAKLASVQRQRGELALTKSRSDVMDLDEVAKGWDKLATVVRKAVLGIPGRARAAPDADGLRWQDN
jgi:phage terminase Nu1 subunit (DNA packaging protein)